MDHNEKKKLAQNHIEQKYRAEFEVVSFTERNLDVPFDELVIQDREGRKFYACIKEGDDGEQIVRDGYYGILNDVQYKQIIRGILNQYLTDYKCFTSFTGRYFHNAYDCDYELADALKDRKEQFFSDTYLFIRDEAASATDRSVYEQLLLALKEQGLTLYLAVYSVTGEAYLRIDEQQDVNLFLPDDYKVNPVFMKTIK